MNNSSPRSWDVAPFIVAAIGLGLLGLTLVSSAVPDSSGDGGSLPVAVGGLVLSLAGFVVLLAALARWSRRARRHTTVAHRPSVTVNA